MKPSIFCLAISSANPASPRSQLAWPRSIPAMSGWRRTPAWCFVENFEAEALPKSGERWNEVKNEALAALALAKDSPPGSLGKQSLQVTATHGQNTGGHLFKVLKPGYDELYLRFYVKFAADHGYLNHFVKLQGSVNPPNWPEGEAGFKHTTSFSTGLEPQDASHLTYPAKPFAPPGIWHLYTYWPEMRSWQNPDGSGKIFYGNDFEPKEPALAARDRWQCLEFMVKLNSSPDKSDGEQAFWVDGKLAARFAPGSATGYWMRDVFRHDETKGKPFEGLRWRTDPRVTINKVWLLHYVNFAEGSLKKNQDHVARNPGSVINLKTSTVWFDDVVVAKKYIGPIRR